MGHSTSSRVLHEKWITFWGVVTLFHSLHSRLMTLPIPLCQGCSHVPSLLWLPFINYILRYTISDPILMSSLHDFFPPWNRVPPQKWPSSWVWSLWDCLCLHVCYNQVPLGFHAYDHFWICLDLSWSSMICAWNIGSSTFASPQNSALTKLPVTFLLLGVSRSLMAQNGAVSLIYLMLYLDFKIGLF